MYNSFNCVISYCYSCFDYFSSVQIISSILAENFPLEFKKKKNILTSQVKKKNLHNFWRLFLCLKVISYLTAYYYWGRFCLDVMLKKWSWYALDFVVSVLQCNVRVRHFLFIHGCEHLVLCHREPVSPIPHLSYNIKKFNLIICGSKSITGWQRNGSDWSRRDKVKPRSNVAVLIYHGAISVCIQ